MSMVDWWLATNTWLRDQSTCSSPLTCRRAPAPHSNPGAQQRAAMRSGQWRLRSTAWTSSAALIQAAVHASVKANCTALNAVQAKFRSERRGGVDGMSMMSRSEEHTSELQSLMRISYAVYCLKKKTQ